MPPPCLALQLVRAGYWIPCSLLQGNEAMQQPREVEKDCRAMRFDCHTIGAGH